MIWVEISELPPLRFAMKWIALWKCWEFLSRMFIEDRMSKDGVKRTSKLERVSEHPKLVKHQIASSYTHKFSKAYSDVLVNISIWTLIGQFQCFWHHIHDICVHYHVCELLLIVQQSQLSDRHHQCQKWFLGHALGQDHVQNSLNVFSL